MNAFTKFVTLLRHPCAENTLPFAWERATNEEMDRLHPALYSLRELETFELESPESPSLSSRVELSSTDLLSYSRRNSLASIIAVKSLDLSPASPSEKTYGHMLSSVDLVTEVASSSPAAADTGSAPGKNWLFRREKVPSVSFQQFGPYTPLGALTFST
ncbi:hypothetical protein HMN09_00214800 [Mycena chlorophos]|uniref:Uncharacterized protein n=1 Tax=Mycena chlorophos TaxID=658473 RepID=A0A8H6WJ38_MYCCL|nr:hypothetical protein HMN09_00214800 [Mycena chlorophos]